MNKAGVKRKSGVDDLLKFDLLDYPPWRNPQEENVKSVNDMIREIIEYQEEWAKVSRTLAPKIIEKGLKRMELEFYFHVNNEEEHGLGTIEDTEAFIETNLSAEKENMSQSQQEVVNLVHAHRKLQSIQQTADELTPLLDDETLKTVHKLILKGIPLGKRTPAGTYSKNIRVTEFKNELYAYKNIKGLSLEDSVQTIIDRYNVMIEMCKLNWQDSRKESVADLFKIAAYLLFEMLDVHPFSDGNGRLCRLLVSYALSFATPFPSSVYNLWSDITSKDAYIEALVKTRKTSERHPHLLAAMIAECNWYGWQKFFKLLDISLGEKL